MLLMKPLLQQMLTQDCACILIIGLACGGAKDIGATQEATDLVVTCDSLNGSVIARPSLVVGWSRSWM
jgi:hypothetical protein